MVALLVLSLVFLFLLTQLPVLEWGGFATKPVDLFSDIRVDEQDLDLPGDAEWQEEGMEFEAFVLNEMCQFTGAFCNSLHCDELGYLCRVPYWLGTVRNGEAVPEKIKALQEQAWDQEPDLKAYDESGYLCGETGCGLCALYQLKQAGITHLKLVGRGNYVDHMEKDIRNLRKALEILDAAENETAFQCMIKRILYYLSILNSACYRKSITSAFGNFFLSNLNVALSSGWLVW